VVEPVLTTPSKKTSGTIRSLYNDACSPTIDPTETVSPVANMKMPAFPKEATTTNETSTVDNIGGTPVIYLAAAVPGEINPTAVLPAVLPATQEGTTASVP
jgi:hypothetical protein